MIIYILFTETSDGSLGAANGGKLDTPTSVIPNITKAHPTN